MRPFQYERASSPDAAVRLISEQPRGARFLGGGTNLVDLMRLGVEEPPALIDVTRLADGAAAIEETADGGLKIGSAVRNSELAADPRVRERYPVLSEAILHGASGQLRNLATTAGNLLQRTRCSYFQDVSRPCNKREPGSGCPAIQGEHHNLAILGASEHCVATHPSDMAVALAALDATVHTLGAGGPRTVPLTDFHRLPGDEPQRDTILEPGELITAVALPPASAAARNSRYVKVRERASFAFALVSLAAAARIEDGVIREVRLALGGVAHRPWRARIAEESLAGLPVTDANLLAAADAQLANAQPLPDNAYKLTIARNLIVDTINDLAGIP